MDLLFEALKSLFEAYGGQYGFVVQAVTWIGTARLVFKPIMAAIESIVAQTPSKDDDKKLEEVKASQWYYWLVFTLDWFASIKFPSLMRGRRK